MRAKPEGGKGCPRCERRRQRDAVVLKVSGVLLLAGTVALAIKWYPTWAESVKVAAMMLVALVTWLITRQPN